MIARCMVRLQGRSGNPEDVFANTYHFESGLWDTLPRAADDCLTKMQRAYSNLADLLSDYISNTVEIRVYNLADPKPRIPEIRSFNVQMGTVGVTNLPEEVAAVLSFHGAPPYTPSRRGRVYIGPLCQKAINPAGNARTPLSSIMITGLNTLFDDLASPAELGDWVVYSETRGSITYVEGGWADDAPDTQRRRGLKAATRNPFGQTRISTLPANGAEGSGRPRGTRAVRDDEVSVG